MVRTLRTAATAALKVSSDVDVLSVICRQSAWCMVRTVRTTANAALRSVWRRGCIKGYLLGRCLVYGKNRKNCSYCRYKKFLAAGMY